MTGKRRGASQGGASELDLMWRMHEALTRGVELDQMLRLVVEGAKALFAGQAASVYLLSDDRRHLLMQNWALPERLTRRIEKLTGLNVRRIPLPVVEGGHYWRVIEERQAVLLDRPEDVEAVIAELASEHPALHKLVPAIAKLLGQRSILTGPLLAGDRVLGVMDLGSWESLREADRQSFQLLTSQVGLVIELARAKERERKQAVWLALANDIGRRASGILNLEVLLQEVVESIHTNFGYHDVLIGMVDHEANELVRGARAGAYVHKAPPGTRKPLDSQRGVVDWVALHGETLVVNDVTQEPRYVALFPETRSELCVPIKRGDRVLGVLNIESRQPAAFDQAAVTAMETLSDYLAAAIENAQLYQEIRGTKAYLENLIASSVDSVATTDEHGIVTFLSPAAERVMGYKAEEVVGQPLWKYYMDGVDEARKVMSILREKGELRDYETCLRHKDGHKIPASLSASLLRDEAGNVIGTLGVAKDIRERKELEDKLSAIYELGREMVLAMDEEQIGQAVLDVAARVLRVPASELLQLDEEREELQVVARRGYPPQTGNVSLSLRGEKGIAVAAARSGKLVYVPDTRQDPRYFDAGFSGLSDVAVPLKARDRVIGVLSLESHELDAFDQADLALISALADQAAIAIENARLYEDARRRADHLTVINRIGRAAGATLRLDELVDIVCQEITRVFQADAFFLALYDEQTRELDFRLQVDEGVREPPERRPLESGLTALVVTSKKPLLIQDFAAEKDRLPQPLVWGTMKLPPSWLGAPMLIGDRVVGVISVQSYQPQAYGQEEQLLLSTIADQVAVAFENARLYEETRRRLIREERLSELAHTLGGEMELATLIPRLLPPVVELTGADAGTVAILDADRQVVTYPYHHNLPGALAGLEVPAGTGLAWHTMQVRRSVLLDDYQQFEAALQPWLEAGVRSTLSTPLVVGDHVVGSMALFTLNEVRPFGPGAVAAAEAVGRLAAVAIQRARLFEAEKRRAVHLTLVNEVSKRVASVLDLDRLMLEAPRLIRDAFDYYNVDLFLIDEERRELVRRGGAGGFEHLIQGEYRQSMDEGIVGLVARTGQPWVANDVSKDPYYVKGFTAEVLTRSELCVPVKVGDKVIGALDVESVQPNSFDQDDVVFMGMLADRIAIGVQNVLLFEETRRRAEELRLLFEATRDISTSLNLNEVLERVAAHLCQAAKATSAHIMILDESGERATVRVSYWSPEASPVERIPDLGTAYDLTRHPTILRALRENRPLVAHVDDPNLAPATREMIASFDGRSTLRVPIHVGGVLRAYALIWESRQRREWTDDEVRLCQALANQAAAAIENARLFADVQQAKTEWEATVDAISDCILLVSPDLRVLRVNQALAERLGSTPQALVGQSCCQLLYQTPGLLDDCALMRAMRTGQPQVEEVEQPVLGGTFLCSTYPLFDIEGRVSGAVHVLRDVTEQKHMQERLLQAEKLAAIGELVSGVAHELNNPLTAVLGYAQLLQAADVSDEVKRDLEKISFQAQRAARIVTNLLDFARKRPPEKRSTDINDLLQRTLALRAYELRVGNVQVQTKLAPDLPWAAVDPHQMQQVLLNVIVNAEQAMAVAHGAGRLVVRSRAVHRPGAHGQTGRDRETRDYPLVRLTVADDGPGISPEITSRIFDPFFTTKDVGQGTGLGLSIAYGIVTGHGGRIWVESPNEWGGATFHIDLPALVDSEWPMADTDQDAPLATGKSAAARILVVEDEDSVADLLRRLLRREGYRVDVAREGGEALRKLDDRHYDLVICDIKMPGMSGLEMYRRVQQTNPELARRIIFATGDTMTPDTRAFLDETGNPFVGKPFDTRQVLRAVRALLEE